LNHSEPSQKALIRKVYSRLFVFIPALMAILFLPAGTLAYWEAWIYLASPLALGSYWAMLPAMLIIPILVARILNEEKVLERELKGYQEYMQKVKYRLVPGLW